MWIDELEDWRKEQAQMTNEKPTNPSHGDEPKPSPAPEVMGTPRNDPKLLDILRRYDESDDPGSMLILAAYEAGKLAQPDPWVDVKVGLPKDEVAKLVFVQETLCHHTAYFDGADWLSFQPNGKSTIIWGVTHWREIQNDIPAPPETRATEGK